MIIIYSTVSQKKKYPQAKEVELVKFIDNKYIL